LKFLVVGGGITGLFLSYYLLEGGHEVVLADATKGDVRTSAYNAGQLSCRPSFTDIFSPTDIVRVSTSEMKRDKDWFDLARRENPQRYEDVSTPLSMRSLELYQRFFAKEKRAKVDLIEEVVELYSVLSAGGSMTRADARFLSPRELSELGYKGFEGGWLKEEKSLHSAKLLDHLRSRIAEMGAKTRVGEARLKSSGSRISYAVLDGERLVADAYVVAAGSWSRALCKPLRYDPMVIPARGLVLFYRTRGKEVVDIPAHYADEGVTVTQHDRDTLRFTGFFELVGFDRRFSSSRRDWLVETVTSHLSRTCRLELIEAGVGFRPSTPDQLPMVGRIPRCENGYIISGSCRKGMVLAPIRGRLLMGRMLGHDETPDPMLRALDPGRFEQA
jgi:glycine/D-amino acid oxidase-like deaminating enzyme